jgi:hypothetical protein
MLRTIAGIAGQGWYGWLTLALAAGATLAAWLYGFSKSPATGLIFLPIGILVFVATVGALAIPLISAVLVVVAALTVSGQGMAASMTLAFQVFLGVGLLGFAWLLWRRRWRR